jgi:hypothetical protein
VGGSEVRALDAAANNAAWCDAVCSAHGRPGELSDHCWISRAPTPSYYPNLVTLDPAPGPALDAIRELERGLPSAAWTVKDSFAALPLERAGFRLLFEAEWIARPAPAAPRPRPGRWIRVRSEPELAAWEAAWGESAGQARIFLPALLQRSDIVILAARDDGGAIAAGGIANRTGKLVGLTNFFAREPRAALRAECIDAALAELPGTALVGYESGESLAEARDLGFRRLGPLRVWLRKG